MICCSIDFTCLSWHLINKAFRKVFDNVGCVFEWTVSAMFRKSFEAIFPAYLRPVSGALYKVKISRL